MIGSKWNKWDLHVHTAFSFNYNTKKAKDMSAEEIKTYTTNFVEKFLNTDIAVIGIMDYWNFNGYKEIIKYIDDRFINKLILPGIELRVEAPTSHRLNYHVLFNDEVELDRLDEFISNLRIRNIERPPNRSGLIDSAKKLDPSKKKHHGFSEKEIDDPERMFELGSQTAEITRESLVGALKLFKSSEYITIAPYESYGGLEKIDWKNQSQADQWFFSFTNAFEDRKDENVKLFNGIKTEENSTFIDDFIYNLGGKPKPVFSGSDSHKISNIGNFPNNKATWIKAEISFDGLRQVLYEPESRVAISEEEPLSPLKKIESVDIKFPNNVELKMKEKEAELFCFSGFKSKLFLNPHFNCIIGGRGTGKSTLLNLIYKSFNPKNNVSFFQNNYIVDSNNNRLLIEDYVEIESTAEEIEYLEQNKIEEFATDAISFTSAIYSRIKKKVNDLNELEIDLLSQIDEIDNDIDETNDLIELIDKRKNIRRNYKAAKKMVTTISSDEYEKLNGNITKTNNEYLRIKRDKEYVSSLTNSVDAFLKENKRLRIREGISSKYRKNYNSFLQSISELKSKLLDSTNFTDEISKEKELSNKLIKRQQELEDYLKKRGITDENLDEVNKKNPENIDKINFKIGFDLDRASDHIFSEFYEYFTDYREGMTLQQPSVARCLFNTDPKKILNGEIQYDDFISSIDGEKQYNNFLLDIFDDEYNYLIYKLIIKKHLFNVVEYLNIEVSYRDRPLEQCSFGQKCTAVILIILLFGNNPILIDEPEAHLDSSLIANYLVDLIKRKKIIRQIVFATHNANFVINGDSENIMIIEMPDSNSIISNSTIENTENRHHLLKLEGGKEAFFQREKKYELERSL